MGKLSPREREKFEHLKARLNGVSRAEEQSERGKPGLGPIDPMLATTFTGELAQVDEATFVAERKFDGTRIILEKFGGEVALYTRRNIERSETLATLTETAESTLPDGIILDGEYTFLTPDGTSQFMPINAGDERIESKALEGSYFVFDILSLDGDWTTREPLERRRAILEDTVPIEPPLAIDNLCRSDFQSYYDALVAKGEEGIILKRRSSRYHLGTRSVHWQKVKAFTETDVLIVGFTAGQGRRADTFGSLVMTDGDRYIGKVGSGFSEETLERISERFTPTDERRVASDDVGVSYSPVEPFVAQVRYQSVTESGTLRAPVFVRLRPEKPIEDVTPR